MLHSVGSYEVSSHIHTTISGLRTKEQPYAFL